MRIDLAYCIEIEKTVDIYQACLEFSKQERYEKFHFLCSDPLCRNNKEKAVRVTGVNHQYLPEDEDISKSPHYRKWDEHLVECEWAILDTILNEPVAKEVERSPQYKLSKKLTRLITRFIVPEGNENTDAQERELCVIRKEKNPEEKKKRLREYVRGAGATATSMEALVSCYEELKTLNALDENLTIVGYGNTTFRAFFKQLKFASNYGVTITHGGARFYKRYGSGFSLSFMDKHQETPVNLYFSPAQIESSPFGPRLARMVDELQNQSEKKPYLKVYWLGGLIKNENDYSVNIASLSHVVFRIAYPKNRAS